MRQGGVVYIYSEGGSGLRQRLPALLKYHGVKDEIPLWTFPCTIEIGGDGSTAKKEEELLVEKILRKANGASIGWLVVDTLNRNIVGDDGSTRDMSYFVKAIDRLRDLFEKHNPNDKRPDCLPIHHSGYDPRHERGSTVLRRAADMVVRIRREPNTRPKYHRVELSCEPPHGKPPKDDAPWDDIELQGKSLTAIELDGSPLKDANGAVLKTLIFEPRSTPSSPLAKVKKNVLLFVKRNLGASQRAVIMNNPTPSKKGSKQKKLGTRAEVKQALTELENEGLIEKKRRQQRGGGFAYWPK